MEGRYRLGSGRRPSFRERSYAPLRGSTTSMPQSLDSLSTAYVVIFEPETVLPLVVRWVRVLVVQAVFITPPDRILRANNKQLTTAPSLTFIIATHAPVLAFPGSFAGSQ